MSSNFASGRARRALSFAAWAVGVTLLVWLLAWWLVPLVAKPQLEKRASDLLGRVVTVGRVDFLPWTLELSLHDIAVARATGSVPQLEVRRLYIDAELQSLVRLAPVIDAIRVEAPVFRWSQLAPGRSDIDDVLERLAAGKDPKPSATEPLRAALYNITLADGAVDFEDRTTGRTQSIRHLSLALPFISTLAAHREVTVTPRLAFELNGSAFETTAQATPFANGHRAEVHLQVKHLDIAPLAAYLPASLPVRVQAGQLDADLRFSFEQAAKVSLAITGTSAIHGARLSDRQDRHLLSFDTLRVQIRDLQPLNRSVQLGAVDWSGVHAEVRRGVDGALDLPGLADLPGSAHVASASAATAAPVDSRWKVAVDRLSVGNARVGWTDQSVGNAQWQARRVNVLSSDIAWPLQKPLRFQADAEVVIDSADAPGTAPAARLALAGQATDRSAAVAFSVQGLPLELAAPYLNAQLRPRLNGFVDADVGLAWNGSTGAVKVAKFAARDVVLACAGGGCSTTMSDAGMAAAGKGRLLDLRSLVVEDTWIRLPQRAVTVGRVTLSGPRTVLARNAQGRWMFEDWLLADAAIPEASTAAPPGGTSAASSWTVRLEDTAVEGGMLAFRDDSVVRPVSVDLAGLQLRLRDFAPLAPPGSVSPSMLSVSSLVGSGRFEPGRLAFDGTVRALPLELQGKVQASHLPLQAFEPYIADRLNVRIVRAEGGFSGNVRHSQGKQSTSTTVQGDVSVDEVRMRAGEVVEGAALRQAPAVLGGGGRNDLLRWKSMGLRGVRLEALPGQPVSLEVAETSLTDLFARVVLQENGRINLRDVVKGTTAQQETTSQPGATPSKDMSSAADAPARAVGAPILRFGPITLSGGAVQFSDRFVKPNYSADLSELTGRLSAFSSVAAGAGGESQMADLELRGKAEGTAALEIVGKLNPLAQPLALDIKVRMRDLDLPPLSPYSVKYAGHGIERGKLTMDVNYRVLPNGELTASNRLVLRQLAFGDPVDGAPSSLPVRLAVALLADRNGVIDVDLPVSGSLNDPQFSLGSVIWRVIGNLVLKAVTSPFSLLTNSFGGAEELDQVEFEPGSTALGSEARARLDKVARALTDRPALSMTVVGEAALDAEREGWKRQRLQNLVRSEKRRSAARSGQDVDQAATVSEDEYPRLLQEAYRRADIAKPRNLVGMAKDLPQAEMENLMLASISVPPEAMRNLALARGVAVRDYLAERSVTADRLFVGAPRVDASREDWVPRASLTLDRR